MAPSATATLYCCSNPSTGERKKRPHFDGRVTLTDGAPPSNFPELRFCGAFGSAPVYCGRFHVAPSNRARAPHLWPDLHGGGKLRIYCDTSALRHNISRHNDEKTQRELAALTQLLGKYPMFWSHVVRYEAEKTKDEIRRGYLII